ncbi:MAG: T9SS type A sorting domain-containing protein, partial [Bacteroidetes bacterium]|nr:T9SS type A sorting domain-containing protein [Bacteroidota bacterium]
FVESGYNGQNIWLTGLADKCWNIDRTEDVTGDGINDLIAGTLYSSNYIYFLDGVNGDILFSQNYGEAVDGIAAIPDITGDGSWELVAGGRDGKLSCVSGGLNSSFLNADFIADTTFGYVPFDVHFTDLTSGMVTSWQWDFENDGVIDSYEQNPVHSYTLVGFYSVELIAGNGITNDTVLKVNYITADSTVGNREYKYGITLSAFPNPFEAAVTITFSLHQNSEVSLIIFNPLGQPVKTLIPDKFHLKGRYNIQWDGLNNNGVLQDQGLYYVYCTTGDTPHVIKLIRK